MEESEENGTQNNTQYDIDNNNEVTDNCDISNIDPIPSLLLPIKKMKKLVSPITYIFSNLKNKNLNLNQIQTIAQKKISGYITNQTLQKHNSSPAQKNIMLINDLIESKETHFIATFKDYLISDYQEEFLRRYFYNDEIKEVLPKFYQYYKNYLKFFCKGTFCDFDVNEIMQEYGESQAEFYYNRNYGHKDRMKKKKKKENIDNNGNNDNSDDMENDSDLVLLKYIFTQSIERSIERVKNSYDFSGKEKKEELSNIKPFNTSNEKTLILPENSTISSDDIITKENSIRYMIDLMKKKKMNKRTKNQKKNKTIKNNINIDNKNKKENNNFSNKSNLNKKCEHTLSKTTSNLNVKNIKKNKNKTIKSRNKSNSIKPNYFTNNNNYKNRNNPTISNYKKYIDILSSNKPKNKSSEPRKRKLQDESGISSRKTNPSNRAKNYISTLNTNDLFNHFNLLSSNNFSNNLYSNKNNANNKNKVNSSLFLLNNIQNIEKNNKVMNYYNYNTLFPTTMPKNNNSKNKHSISKKSENKEKKNSKSKRKDNYQNFNHNIKSFIKTMKNVSSSPKSLINGNSSNNNNNGNNNNSNTTSNKSLSYSTVNNCNININNNFILSNNYFNNKQNHHLNQPQTNASSKKSLDKAIQYKKSSNSGGNTHNSNNPVKPPISRNTQNDLNRFKTDSNMFNSIGNDNKLKINKNTGVGSINQYKSFRKSNNNHLILIKNKNFDRNKKYNNSNNHHRNFSLKNIPITVKNNLYSNANNTSNRGGGGAKLFEEIELNSINKTYKNLGLKKNSNNSHQKKIIFDYKRK